MADKLNAKELGERSRAAVGAKDREGWLDIFAPDGVVEDPIGPSPFDPEGRGHRGREAIAAFYDNVIAGSERIDFDIEESVLCGDEAAAVGTIRTTLAGGKHVAVTRCIFTYRADSEGRLAALRSYWEIDKMELIET
ncbi:MAG TPA: nuclear transport factor 2 family protein [Acidimicrobiales bacterium]|nr:nuclear transport factor 2 family protein [Acidimicrobiales bacterium]